MVSYINRRATYALFVRTASTNIPGQTICKGKCVGEHRVSRFCKMCAKLTRNDRHVRVHHVDKDKDDAQLRDVLAQRPEGGSRGRRRRVSDSDRR